MLTAVSVVLGIAASIGLTRWMRTLLFGVNAIDPWTLAAMSAVIAIIVMLACYVPARRASRVDPIVALRQQ
jgi:ABC-type antimicrobial peptide transport system permease subunit